MGSIDRRLQDLEERFAAGSAHEPSEISRHLRAVLDEFAALKQSCAVRWTPEGTVPGENVPRRVLGPGYTHEDLWRLAVLRTVDAGRAPAERVEAYVGFLRGTWERAGKDPGAVVEWERRGAYSGVRKD